MRTDDIWPTVRSHAWKYRKRSRPIRLILIHATRSSQPYDSRKEYGATINWFTSPGNRQTNEGEMYGSMASRIIGDSGAMCIVMPDDVYPAYSAGHMDPIAKSYEVAQATNDTPFNARDIDRLVVEVAADCKRYGIPPVELAYVSGDNHEAPGIAFHDRSANGTVYGKSDPGKMFDRAGFVRRVARLVNQEDEMAIKVAATMHPQTGYRVYAIGQQAALGSGPQWITDPIAVAELERVFGARENMAWAALQGLGAK